MFENIQTKMVEIHSLANDPLKHCSLLKAASADGTGYISGNGFPVPYLYSLVGEGSFFVMNLWFVTAFRRFNFLCRTRRKYLFSLSTLHFHL